MLHARVNAILESLEVVYQEMSLISSHLWSHSASPADSFVSLSLTHLSPALEM